jgi:hypothetical protein
MARIRVTFDGSTAVNGSSLLMHNERLADPLDPYTRWLGELTSKRKKTERDLEETGRREFLGGGYWQVDTGPDGEQAEPYIPTWNIIRCLQAGATKFKLGRQVVRGLVPVNDITSLLYDGPRDADSLWRSSLFVSRKGVGVGQAKVIRTRPAFTDWKVEAELELDLTILDPPTVAQIAVSAGLYEGLGDNRPRHGRFLGSVELLSDPADYAAAINEMDEVRAALVRETALNTIAMLDAAHATAHPNGKERKKRVAKQVS